MTYTHRIWVSLTVAVMLLVGCASSDATKATSSDVATSEPTVATTTTTAPTTTTTAPTTTTTEPAYSIEWDVPYLETASSTLSMNIYQPVIEGPHPVLIAYHGGNMPNKGAMHMLGTAAAEAGILAYAPEWPGLPSTTAAFSALAEASACSVWASIAHAAEHGGDLDRITVFGISAGASKAAAVGIYPSPTHEGCLAEPTPFAVDQIILHEGGLGLHPTTDKVFAADGDLFGKATVWGHIAEPTAARVRLLVDTVTLGDERYDGNSYLGPSETVESSLSLRDRSLADDAERLGLLDDGRINITEVAVVLEERMAAAGWNVDLTWITDASHSVSGTAIDFVIDSILGR